MDKDKKIQELENHIELLKGKIRSLEYQLEKRESFVEDMFQMYKKHNKLKFRNVVR